MPLPITTVLIAAAFLFVAAGVLLPAYIVMGLAGANEVARMWMAQPRTRTEIPHDGVRLKDLQPRRQRTPFGPRDDA